MAAEKTENGASVSLDRMIQPMLLLLILKSRPTVMNLSKALTLCTKVKL